MSNLRDLKNRVFGRLTVIERAGSNRWKHALWRCRCSCGNGVIIVGASLVNGSTTSCGCYRASGDARATHGATRGGIRTPSYRSWRNMKSRCDNPRLPQFADYGGRGIAYSPDWTVFKNFLRDMGEPPTGTSLDRIDNERGYSKENCRWADRVTQRINQRPYNAQPSGRLVLVRQRAPRVAPRPPAYHPKPRDTSRDLPAGIEHNFKHGQRAGDLYLGKRPRGYAAWVNMRSRCRNPNVKAFKYYGGRGISYSPRWEEFLNFIADMGEPPPNTTLDRIDNNGNYTAENCRWATRAVQALNKRNCVRYELNGKSQTLAEWSRETGIGRITMLKRIQAGVPLEIALTERRNLRSVNGCPPEMRAKLRAANLGKKHPYKERDSAFTPEHIAALRLGQQRRRERERLAKEALSL